LPERPFGCFAQKVPVTFFAALPRRVNGYAIHERGSLERSSTGMTSAADDKRPRIAVVGGGLAGLAAAVAASDDGMQVELFEQGKTLGGRAGSFVDTETGQTVDYCQHVAMGCCTELLDFCRHTGIDDCFEQTDTLHFISPDGSQRDFTPSRWLPAPLHLLPGLLRLDYLSWSARWGIVRAMRKLVGGDSDDTTSNCPHPNPLPKGEGTIETYVPKGEGTIGTWLQRQGQSQRAIERFWSVVLVSALGETVDRASLAAARKVFRDGFWASRGASRLVLPRRPLVEIFHDRLGRRLADRGVTVHLGASVRRIEGDHRRAGALILADGTSREFDFVVVAVPWRGVRSLFAENLLESLPRLADVERIEPAAITAIHFWFDRPITRLPHAVLVGRLSQWLFASGTPALQFPQYCQVVVSASHRLARRKSDEWLADVRSELESVWPEARAAKLLHGRVVTMPAAIFSVTPESERLRPPQETPLENLCLAGDWTSTGWPATMEGAIRSGRQAIEALCRHRVDSR
jgi:squalene-associated FAD-dependent desaturase